MCTLMLDQQYGHVDLRIIQRDEVGAQRDRGLMDLLIILEYVVQWWFYGGVRRHYKGDMSLTLYVRRSIF